MSRSIFRKLLSMKPKPDNKRVSPARAVPAGRDKLSGELAADLDMLRNVLGNSMDLVIREFMLCDTRAALVYINGIIDKEALRENVLRALMVDTKMVNTPGYSSGNSLAARVKENVLSIANVKEAVEIGSILEGILGAGIALLFEGDHTALTLKLPAFETRSVGEPQTESVVRGPREGFVEYLYTNLSMLRRKIKSPDLRLERMQVGRVTGTDVCVAYIKGIANPKIVEEVKKRLERIELDGVLESGYIEEFIEDAPFSIFPTVGNTEKPDRVAAQLLEGRVAIFTDGTPFVLTVPYLFLESVQASEDYYSRHFSSSLFRSLRILALILTTELPALYVAISSFNPEILPTPLLLTMASSREGVPLPAIGEVLVMGVIFEVLREAGVRLPRPVGQAVSIVGALVLGDAAVSAGLVSAPAVIVTALTGIASFVVPSQSDAQIFIRFCFTIMAGFAGFFGLFLGFALILIHLASLRSYGTPYLSPLAPFSKGDLRDTFTRFPWWAMGGRPRVIGWRNPRRAGNVSPPAPPGDKRNSRGEGDG
ncbi:spore germination protein GerKA [Desulfocucumis palustris]|uniref:Spore germination protein GerKA n=1 Tax=Desulfocucumis palustris TaxID=1898651 RepID=A0A2L2XFX2_9FIRM|nr:spore germination protein [Desulfocucumis palustris]GBF35115.1 spore germination protein GerKA [Desulfocucumis palustris]